MAIKYSLFLIGKHMRSPDHYIKNKDLLEEIHLSKCSYCKFEDAKYSECDYIVSLIPEDYDTCSVPDGLPIDSEIIELARVARAIRLQKKAYNAAMKAYRLGTKPKEKEFEVDPTSILDTDIVFRVHTFDHIPKDLSRKKTHRRLSDSHVKLNFVPFKHFVIADSETYTESYSISGTQYYFREVGRSHTDKDGNFSLTCGKISDRLARMYLLLVERYSEKSNWCGYSYLDEMKSAAILQLTYAGLQFNEMKSDNPFSYLTTFLSNSFTRVLNIEKANQDLRDDLLSSLGYTPSNSRQIDNDEAARTARNDYEGE